MKVDVVRSPFTPQDSILIASGLDLEGTPREDFTIVVPEALGDDVYRAIELMVEKHNAFDGAMDDLQRIAKMRPVELSPLIKALTEGMR